MSLLVGDKLYETAKTAIRSTELIQELKIGVEFPDIRNIVNTGHLSFVDIIQLRRKARRFREWIQTESDRDRDAIAAYHNEVAQESGLMMHARKAVSLFGILGAGALGAALGNTLGGTAGSAVGGAVGSGTGYIFDLAANIGKGWEPVVFGAWLKSRIDKALADE